ncbi:MAG TPA: phytanoyl-CoA dioxygenase family protein [Planctomycetota bacterium]|nr:phytanoyl-CoA dioxygenase family protein [Planctomycetota bacterium]
MEAACEVGCINDALAVLGVDDEILTADEKRSLDEKGYVLFERLIEPDLLQALRERYDAIADAEGSRAGMDYHQEDGALRLGNLVNKGDCFTRVWTHPKYLAACWHIFKSEFRLSSISAREPLPNSGKPQQGLHPDYWGDAHDASCPNQSADAAFMLDDFSPENGATRLVPGSHRWQTRPEHVMKSTSDDHPEQIIVTAPAGTVLVYNGHTWHSGTLNTSGKRRRALFPYMVAEKYWDNGQYQWDRVLKKTWDAFNPAQRYVLFGSVHQ